MSFSPPKQLTAADAYETPAELADAQLLKRQIPSWAISFGAHALVMFLCLFIVRPSGERQHNLFTDAFDDSSAQDLGVDATATDVVATGDVGTTLVVGNGGPANAAETHVQTDVQTATREKVSEKVLEVRTVGVGPGLPTGQDTDVGATFQSSGASETTGTVEGSLDRLTHEITMSLKDDKTLAVWLFDASQSLRDRRNAIADRFENVYKQLGQLNVGTDKALKTAAVSFGEKFEILTPEPVDDIKEVAEKVRKMKDDVSGKENTLTALMAAANKFLPYRLKMKRNVMLIVVTDERGDDFFQNQSMNIETELVKLRKWGMKVFVVGNAAVFGREKGYITFKESDGTVWTNQPVDLGPESFYPERIELPFFGVSVADIDHLSSSFGPYGLTRLCTETGGLYLITDDSRKKFDPLVMKSYRPDYRPLRQLDADIKQNRAKMALIEAAKNTSLKTAPSPELQFRADNDNNLRQEITAAQPLAAKFDYPLQEMQQILEKGEKDRDKLDSPRWRASYDLALGRVLAMRVRYYGFQKMVAEMKVNPKPFKTAGNNKWILESSADITSGPDVKKLEKRAREYLSRVIDEHPGTPWAFLAEQEMSKPLGWAWKEAKDDYVTRDRNAAEARRVQLARDEEAKKDPKKAQMNKPKPAPKL